MGLFNRLFGRRVETRAFQFTPEIGAFSMGGGSDAGVSVTEANALTASAVYAAVSCITNSIACLPVHVLNRKSGEKVNDHPVGRVLRDEPNEFQTGVAWRETMLLQLLLWGNCYSAIERDALGHPVALLPLRSDRTRPMRQNGRIIYETRLNGGPEYIPTEDMLHIANMSLDGVTGISPIQQARQSIGLSLALEKFAGRFFGQNCNAGGVLTVQSLKSEGMKAFAEKFRASFSGPENSYKTIVLENGMTYTPHDVNPEKSQALQQRVHQLREVARIYRVPPHKIGDLERSTFSNIEHQSIEWVQDCLMPWIVKIEASCQQKMFLEVEKPELEIKLNIDGLLRGDFKTRLEGYAIAINNGVMTRAEARAKEGLPFLPGSEVLLQPLNMGVAGAPSPTPTPPPDPTAARGMIEATAKRFVTKEQRAIERAMKKHQGRSDEFRAWAEGFYEDHVALVSESLTPALKAAGSSVVAGDYAKRHCAAGLAMLTRGMVEKWTAADITNELNDRPAQVADDILNNGGLSNAAA